MILAGDICAGGRQSVEYAASLTENPTILVAGNHEFYGHEIGQTLADMREHAAKFSHVHFLENGVATVGDLRFVGATLWTDMRLHSGVPINDVARQLRRGMNDYRMIKVLRSDGIRRKKIEPKHTLAMHRASRQFLHEALSDTPDGVRNVVVSHHVPHLTGAAQSDHHDSMAPAYVSDLSQIIEKYRPPLWIHGHTHHSHQTMIGGTLLVSNARGYAENTGDPFREDFVIEI